LRHLVYGVIKGEFVGPRRLCEAAEFSNELQRRRTDFFFCRRRFEVVQGLNVSTHNIYSHLARKLKPTLCATNKIHRRKKVEKQR